MYQMIKDSHSIFAFDDNGVGNNSTQTTDPQLCKEREARSPSVALHGQLQLLENEKLHHIIVADSSAIRDLVENTSDAVRAFNEDAGSLYTPSVAQKLTLQPRSFRRCREEEHDLIHEEHLSHYENSDVSSTCTRFNPSPGYKTPKVNLQARFLTSSRAIVSCQQNISMEIDTYARFSKGFPNLIQPRILLCHTICPL
jgi:hypothetical protein